MEKKLNSLIGELAAQRNMALPTQDESGRFLLLLDGELAISLVQRADRIVLEGQVGPLPDEPGRAEALLERLLKARFARLKRRREILSIDPESGELVVSTELDAPALDLSGLEGALAALAGSLEYWREQLSHNAAPSRPSPAMRVLYP